MGKSLYIAEKPSVAREFARVLKISGKSSDGYMESQEAVVTWCVGHLITMSYPESYDPALKKWSLETLPFIPEQFKYEVINDVKKQFKIVAGLLNRKDVETIYICTDSGREGEYIYRLVDQMAGVKNKVRKRVWIDSQTEEEILRGVREAKDWAEYDNLSASAYLRAKEDYLMGINFSRLLTLKYGQTISNFMHTKYTVLSVGRVMTCVLGMVVRREREIRNFVKTPYYRVLAKFDFENFEFEGEWRSTKDSAYYNSPLLYKENGFKKKEDAAALIEMLTSKPSAPAVVEKAEKKKEKKNPPLLYNLAELQNDCSKMFKLSPDETLKAVQELYEKKLVTYPRTDARVLSSAVAKEIYKNLAGLRSYPYGGEYAAQIVEKGGYKNLASSRYVNDKQITDHYAIIPTGQGLSALNAVSQKLKNVYEIIVRRFLCIFYPAAEYQKISVVSKIGKEAFFTSYKGLLKEGYLKILKYSFSKQNGENSEKETQTAYTGNADKEGGDDSIEAPADFAQIAQKLKKGAVLEVKAINIKEGETSPPKRYNSGSMILAMENAGQLIEDEELRAQIKCSGIGTSATRAEILKKLVTIKYLALNKKTQIITPTQLGENVYDVVECSIKSLLNPELTASWEKGLTYVAEGTITSEEYMQKLEKFIAQRVYGVISLNNQYMLRQKFTETAANYK